jgi:predicted ArsR family transcriptional regulator
LAECLWIWRGRVKSRWQSLGFDYGLFDLFIKMKGAKTRVSLLEMLSTPRDRLQLAQQLDLDWKAIDYHISLLDRRGLVHEETAIGKVRMFRRTAFGESLLRLLNERNG